MDAGCLSRTKQVTEMRGRTPLQTHDTILGHPSQPIKWTSSKNDTGHAIRNTRGDKSTGFGRTDGRRRVGAWTHV